VTDAIGGIDVVGVVWLQYGRAIGLRPYDTIRDVFAAVAAGSAAYGVVPVENSLEGPGGCGNRDESVRCLCFAIALTSGLYLCCVVNERATCSAGNHV